MGFLRFLRVNAAFLSVGVLLTFTSSFGQTFFISIFAGELRAEFGLSHAAWGGIYAAGTIASAGVMIWLGALTDVFRVRVLSVFILTGLAVACLLMALNAALIFLPVVIFALRLGGQGMSSHIATVAMARWYVAARGRALSVASIGFSLGEALLPILFVSLMAVLSWRALWVLAAIMVISVLPLVVRLLRLERTPQAVTEATRAVGMEARQWSRGDVLRHWLFWVMVPAIAGPSAFGTAFFFQQVHLAEAKGWSHLELVALFPIYTIASVAFMLISGWAIDLWGTRRIAPLVQIPAGLGFLVFGIADGLGLASLGIFLMAASFGLNATFPGAFWAEFYGTRHLGAIKSVATSVMIMGSAAGPAITGYLIDRGLDFPDQMAGIGIWFMCIAILVAGSLRIAARALPQSPKVDIVGA